MKTGHPEECLCDDCLDEAAAEERQWVRDFKRRTMSFTRRRMVRARIKYNAGRRRAQLAFLREYRRGAVEQWSETDQALQGWDFGKRRA